MLHLPTNAQWIRRVVAVTATLAIGFGAIAATAEAATPTSVSEVATQTGSPQAVVTGVDVSAPVLSQFDFTPKSVDVSAGSKSVTVTARVTDATGVAYPPSVYLSSDRTSQSLGSVDDDPNLGNGHRWDLPGHHHRAHHRCVRDVDCDDRPAV